MKQLILAVLIIAVTAIAEENSRISLSLDRVGLNDIVRMVRVISGVENIEIDPDIPDTLEFSINADDKDWQKVMDDLLRQHKLVMLDPTEDRDSYLITFKKEEKLDPEELRKHADTALSKEESLRIAELITLLGAKEHKERDKAAGELSELGNKAIPALLDASKSKDPEVQLRAAQLLESIKQDLKDKDD